MVPRLGVWERPLGERTCTGKVSRENTAMRADQLELRAA